MNSKVELLSRLTTRYVGPARRTFDEAWVWWISELAELLPDKLRNLLDRKNRRLLLSVEADAIVVGRQDGESLVELGRLPLARSKDAEELAFDPAELEEEPVLVLPARKVLSKRIELPSAAEENLRGVLEFEMDRETPFTAEQVYFDGSVVERSAAGRTIGVELLVAQRSYLDELLDSLTGRGLAPAAVTARRKTGQLIAADILPAARKPDRPTVFNKLNVSLAVLACLLLAAAVALPIQQKRTAIAELTPQVEAASDAAREGSRIRDNIERLHVAAQSLIDRKSSSPTILELLDETTRILPDEAWASDFDGDGVVVRLKGEAPVAAALIELLDESERFDNPEFLAPVTRVRGNGNERFDMAARWSRESQDDR